MGLSNHIRHAQRLLMALLVVTLCSQAAQAASIDRSNPETLLKQATDALLQMSREARDYAKDDRQRYYDNVASILDQVIDKDYFARGVMATYASARLYRSLETDAERKAFRDRVYKFADTLEEVLIEKYADALLAFDGERIEVEKMASGNDDADKVNLMQTIYDKGDQNYEVQYNLAKKKDGNWLIYNVIVEGINLGATYRNQFADAVEKNRGDVDYVVDNWKALMSAQNAKDNAKEKPTQ